MNGSILSYQCAWMHLEKLASPNNRAMSKWSTLCIICTLFSSDASIQQFVHRIFCPFVYHLCEDWTWTIRPGSCLLTFFPGKNQSQWERFWSLKMIFQNIDLIRSKNHRRQTGDLIAHLFLSRMYFLSTWCLIFWYILSILEKHA